MKHDPSCAREQSSRTNDPLEPCDCGASAGAWQPIATAPRDRPFLVCWALGKQKPVVEMVGGWKEYEEVRSYGEPEAYGWYPLPAPLLSPMTDSDVPSAEEAIGSAPRECWCAPVTAAGVMVKHPECPAHGTPKVTRSSLPEDSQNPPSWGVSSNSGADLFGRREDPDKSVRTLRWLAQIVGSGRFREIQCCDGNDSVVDPLQPPAKVRIARVLNRAAELMKSAVAAPSSGEAHAAQTGAEEPYPMVDVPVWCAHCETVIARCPECGKQEWRIGHDAPDAPSASPSEPIVALVEAGNEALTCLERIIEGKEWGAIEEIADGLRAALSRAASPASEALRGPMVRIAELEQRLAEMIVVYTDPESAKWDGGTTVAAAKAALARDWMPLPDPPEVSHE